MALCIDLVAKAIAANAAHYAALRIDSNLAGVADTTAAIGLLAALLGGVCGTASLAKAEQGSVAPLIILACSYLLIFLITV